MVGALDTFCKHSLNDDHEPEALHDASVHAEPAALEAQATADHPAVLERPVVSAKAASVVSITSAPSVQGGYVGRQASVSLLSGPGGVKEGAPPRTGTYVSSTMIYITSCFGCSCLAMPWVRKGGKTSRALHSG